MTRPPGWSPSVGNRPGSWRTKCQQAISHVEQVTRLATMNPDQGRAYVDLVSRLIVAHRVGLTEEAEAIARRLQAIVEEISPC